MALLKETKVSKSEKVKGLCATCIHKEDCIFCKQASAPILHCEEFDGLEPVVKVLKVKGEASEELNSELKGLCKNCANRETCTFPKPKSGVWHCEEYR